jgi:uncharacterized lipoprotein NlpE involved in copper resistance
MRSPLRYHALLASVLFLAGCQNRFRDSYKPSRGSPDVTLARYSGTTHAQYTGDLPADSMRLVEPWYAPLGTSAFKTRTTEELAQWVAQGQVEKQGAAVGADVVLWSNRFLGSAKTMVAQFDSQPGTLDTTEDRFGSPSTSMTPAMGTVEMVPETIKRYAYTAVYFRKATGYVCGLGYADLPDSLLPNPGRNPGALITRVIPGTPASKARILVGDLVVRVNDRKIDSSATLSSVIDGTRGQTDTFILIRNGEPKAIAVALNP